MKMEYSEIEETIKVIQTICHKIFKKLSYKDVLELIKKVSDKFIVPQVRTKEFFYMLNRVVLENNSCDVIFRVSSLDRIEVIDIQEVIEFLEFKLQEKV